MLNFFEQIKDGIEYIKWKKDIYYDNYKLDFGDYDTSNSRATVKGLKTRGDLLLIPDLVRIPDEYFRFSHGYVNKHGLVNKVDLANSEYLTNIKKICIGIHVESFKINGKTDKLKTIELKPSNDHLAIKEGVLYDNKLSLLMFYPCNIEEEVFVIPSTVKKIQSNAFFECNYLKKIIFNNKEISIEKSAFNPVQRYEYDFISLLNYNERKGSIAIEKFDPSVVNFLNEFRTNGLEFNIPERHNNLTIEEIGLGAFENVKSLRKIYIPKTIKHIAYNCFQNCDNLSEVLIDENNPYFKYENGIIYTKDGKTIVTVIKQVVSSLDEVKLPASVEDYNNLLIAQNMKFNKFVIENNDYLKTIEGVLYSKSGEVLIKYPNCLKNQSFNCPEGVKKIYDSAFEGCVNLKELILSKSITNIGENAFKNCENLESINIPAKVDVSKLCDNNVFENCPKISIKYDSKYSNDLKYSYNEDTDSYTCVSFENCFDKHIIVPPIYNGKRVNKVECNNLLQKVCNSQVETLEFSEGIKDLKINLESYNEKCNITTIFIPSTVDSICISCNSCEKLTSINVSNDNKKYKSIDGVLYTKDSKIILAYPFGKKDKLFRIIDGVEIIEQNVFKNNKNLVRVIMPNSVVKIKNRAFDSMKNLNAVYLSSKIEVIGDYAFAYCEKLNYINLSNKYNLYTIGDSAFNSCPLIECIFDSNNYEEYFYNTELDENKYYTVNTKSVSGYYEFELDVIEFEDKLVYIGNSAFKNSPFIYGVTQNSYNKPKSKLVIEEKAFENCQLVIVKLHGNVEIKDGAFESAFTIEKYYDISTQKDEMFGGSVYFYDDYPIINNTAFKYCDYIKIYFHEDEPYINDYKFIIRIGEEAEMYWNVDEEEVPFL